jgi:O-antigen biosynthesis protein
VLPVSIVVVSYGSAGYLAECLASLLENCAAYGPAQVALVENHPDAAQVKKTRQAAAPFLKQGLQFWPTPANLGYGGAANWGWSRLKPAAINLVLNPDMSFPAGWLAAFVRPFEQNPAIGIVGCKLLHADGKIQHAGGLVRRDLGLAEHFGAGEPDDGRWDESCPVEFVTGAALGVRAELVERLGGFDPAFFPGYYEDVDLCRRVRQPGYKVWYEAAAKAYHYEGGSFGRGLSYYLPLHRNRLRYIFKHFSTRQMLGEFLPAEQVRQQSTMDRLDRQASAMVYHAAARSYSRPFKLNPANQPQEKPTDLKENINSARIDLYDASLEDPTAGEIALSRQIGERVAAVKQSWLVEEKPFRSRLPFVATLRERFNSISTRWYIKPILAQQVDYNAAVARAIEDLGKLAAGSQSVQNLQVATLSERMLSLEQRLERIETLLEKLTGSPTPDISEERPQRA